jgi:hypothetical protein
MRSCFFAVLFLSGYALKFTGDMLKKTSGTPAGISGGLLKPGEL